jgi:hypothetical protein
MHNIAFHCLNRLQSGAFTDGQLLQEAKDWFGRVKALRPDDLETGFLEAALIIAESELAHSDCGIARARSLLDKIVMNQFCDIELAKTSHINLQKLEELQQKCAAAKREELIRRELRRRGRQH